MASLEGEVARLSKVRNGSWHEAMYYERLEKQIKLLKRRQMELWGRYGFDSKDGRRQHPEMWKEYVEVRAQIEALEGEYANQRMGGGPPAAHELHRRKGGQVDVAEVSKRIAHPDQP